MLDGPSQWTRWLRDMEDWLGYHGHGLMLSGQREAIEPHITNEGVAARALKLIEWEKQQSKALAAIRHRCGQNARDEINGEETIAAALAKLRTCYRPTGSAVFQSLNYTYRNLRLAECKGVSNFAERLKRARDDIQALDQDAIIGEPHFVDHFLNGLGDRYATFLEIFYQGHSLISDRNAEGVVQKKAVSFDEAVMAAERQEQALVMADSKEVVALAAHNDQPACKTARTPAIQMPPAGNYTLR
jgi:hypothetical protein